MRREDTKWERHKRVISTIKSANHTYRWRTIWYIATVAFDAILHYLRCHEDKNTKTTTLFEFQEHIAQFIDDIQPWSQKNSND